MTLDSPLSCPVTVEREYWMLAADAFDSGDFETAAIGFRKIGNKSKPSYNVAVCYLNLNDEDSAMAMLQKSISCDPFLALSLFQLGNLYLRKGAYLSAISEYRSALERMRDNGKIDYTQLGLNFELNAAEILYNQAMAYFMTDDKGLSVRCLVEAHRFREQRRYEVITEALRSDLRSRWLPFEVPKELIFRTSNKPRSLSMSSVNFPPIEKVEPCMLLNSGSNLEESPLRKHSRSSTLTSQTPSVFMDLDSQVGKVYLIGDEGNIDQIRLIDMSTISDSFQELQQRVSEKLTVSGTKFKLKFKDDEGDLITMVDDSDLQAALHVTSLSSKISRLTLWCYPVD